MVSKFVEGKCRLLLLGNRDSSNCVPHLTLRVPRRALSFSGKCILGNRSSQPMSQSHYPCAPFAGFQHFSLILVACYATLHPAMSVGRSVGWLVPFILFGVFELFEHTAPAQTQVTFSSTAPAHPHATRVTVYQALFKWRIAKDS